MRRFIVLVMLALVSAPSVAEAQEWRALLSPGPVAKSHEPHAAKCDACHLVFKGIPNSKCLKCHNGLKQRIEANVGYHVTVASQECRRCHTDHKGAGASQTTDEALKAFDHNATGFALRGAHKDVDCKSCHVGPIQKMAAACGSCHEDPHESKLGTACQTCHNDLDWKKDLKTLADHKVRTDGGHEGLKCYDCHESGKHLKEEVGCESCHEQQHGGTKAPCSNCHNVTAFKPAKFDHSFCTCKFPGKHKTVSCLSCHEGFKFTNTSNLCSSCHLKDLTHDRIGECSRCHSAITWKNNRFDHNSKRSKFHLTKLHLTVDCDRCHMQKKRGRTLFRAAPEDCKGCHAQEGLEAHGDFGACEQCHTTEGFEKPTFDHASTGFIIAGRHDDLECQDCHAKKTKDFPKKVKTTSFEQSPFPMFLLAVFPDDKASKPAAISHAVGKEFGCDHCHADPHKGQASGTCEDCHTTKDWKPTTFDPKRHAKTKFPLKGKHVEADCESCHVDAQLKGMPLQCAGCHVDIHKNRFGNKCQDCHSEAGFKPVEGFDHALTGFALRGNHEKLKCAKCHTGANKLNLMDADGKYTCETCHAPKHASDMGAACKDCHSENVLFTEAKFDHRKTGFSLERRHASLSCAKCHIKAQKMKPIAKCGTCHIEPHAGQLTPTCERCHQPDRWSLVRFDHDRAGWPLRGRHFVTSCMSCHTSERWFGLTTDCYDCHALDAARGAAVAPAAHPFGRLECANCHFSGFTWRTL